MEETEKTLLQQIREKEQEYAKKIEVIKKETDAAIASAQSEAESLLCTADSCRKNGGRTALLAGEREDRDRDRRAQARGSSRAGYGCSTGREEPAPCS